MNRYSAQILKLADPDFTLNNPDEAYLLNREVKEGWLKIRKEMLAKQFRYLLRVTLQFKNESLGTIKYAKNQERTRRGLNEEKYPNEGNHIAIFECQLKQPPMFSINEMTHREFLMSSRINFVNWRIVDFDNYMLGNKHFTEIDEVNPQEKY